VSQRLSGGISTGKGNPAEIDRMKTNDGDNITKLKEDYRALLSAYEAAKSEADHAKAALQELKQVQVSKSVSKISTPSGPKGSLISSLGSPAGSFAEKDGMLQFVDQFESVLDEVKRQENIITDLKEKLSNRSTQNWSALVAKVSLRKQISDAWKEAKTDIAELTRENMEHLQRIRDLEQEIVLATDARDSSSRRYDLVKARYDQEIENIKEIYEAQLSALKSSSESEGLAAERRIEEAIQSAAIDAERRCTDEYEEQMASLRQEIDSLHEQCQALRHEKDLLEQEFENFKNVKDASIDLLEQRLNVSRKTSAPGIIDRKDALKTISNACRDDAVRAAVQEAQLERFERQKLQQEMQVLIETHDKGFENIPSNRDASMKGFKQQDLQDSLTRADNKIRRLEKLLQGAEDSTDKEEIKRWQQEANQLQNEIVSLTLHMPKNH
jgi:chromosome segregation ATPase